MTSKELKALTLFSWIHRAYDQRLLNVARSQSSFVRAVCNGEEIPRCELSISIGG